MASRGRVTKGIVLAGGAGTRLYPLTEITSKQLLPVYDKPMVYYPLATLISGGISDILLISTPRDLPRFREVLGDGSRFGIALSYIEQPQPEGIAQSFILGREFIAGQAVCLILGDNLFYGEMDPFFEALTRTDGATIFGYPVRDPQRYGVIELDHEGRPVSIEEKPAHPRSSLAVPGLYVYDGRVCDFADALRPSGRGELEITDLNRAYMAEGMLRVGHLGRGTAWLDTGTPESLHAASTFVATIEQRQSVKIGCPEEAALRQGLISPEEMLARLADMPATDYRAYVEAVCRELAEGA